MATVIIPKWHKSIFIPNPKVGDFFMIDAFPEPVRITKIRAEREGGTSVTFNLRQRAEGSYGTSVGEVDVFPADEVVTADETWLASNGDFFDYPTHVDDGIFYECVGVVGSVTSLVIVISGSYN